MLLAQLLTNGLQTGALYALVAAGFSLIFGMTRVFHAAHGATFTIAGFAFYQCYAVLHLDPVLSTLICAVCAGAFGVARFTPQVGEVFSRSAGDEPLGALFPTKQLLGLFGLSTSWPKSALEGLPK